MIPTNPIFHKPKSIIAAKNLLYTSIFLGIINYIIGKYTPALNTSSTAEGLIIIIVTSIIIFVLTKQIGLGKKWARTVLLILFILGMIPYCFIIVPMFEANLLLGVFSVLQVILQVMALVFLFSRASSEWFNKVGMPKDEKRFEG